MRQRQAASEPRSSNQLEPASAQPLPHTTDRPETGLRAYEKEPWKADVNPERRAQMQSRRFQEVFNQFNAVITEARNQRLVRLRIVEGAAALSPESPGEAEAKRRNRVPAELRLACACTVNGPVCATASYW